MARSKTKRRDVIALEKFLPYRVARLDDRLGALAGQDGAVSKSE